MSIIHVNQILKKLENLFWGKIDMSDLRGDANQNENFFRSRALAAYAIHYLAQADADAAAASVVDGSNDNGIDAIYHDEVEKLLYVVQSKFIHGGKGEPENGDVKKFLAGVRDLFNLSFDRFNPKVQKKRDSIAQALNDTFTNYQIVIVYTGINSLAGP